MGEEKGSDLLAGVRAAETSSPNFQPDALYAVTIPRALKIAEIKNESEAIWVIWSLLLSSVVTLSFVLPQPRYAFPSFRFCVLARVHLNFPLLFWVP